MERELEERVRVMFAEKLDLGVPCSNQDCSLNSTCERFYDPLRLEYQNLVGGVPSCVAYNPDRDNCFVLRRRLVGSMDNHREWTKTTKRHRRRGGNWS